MAYSAIELLDGQPSSVADLSKRKRDAIVVSSILDNAGNVVVISYYGDVIWKLWPYFEQSNKTNSEKIIDWSNFPDNFRDVAKAVLYRYWKVGRPGWTLPGASTIYQMTFALSPFFRHLEQFRITSLLDVKPLHLQQYVQERKGRGIGPDGLFRHFSVIELLYLFKAEHPEALQFPPWKGSSPAKLSNMNWDRKSGRTPIIPVDIIQQLFIHAEQIVTQTKKLIQEKNPMPPQEKVKLLAKRFIKTRRACIFLIGILTGMRQEEIIGIEVGAGRTEIRNGVTFYWVKSIEHKTKKGCVEYLAQPLVIELLSLMEECSSTLRASLHQKVVELEASRSRLTADQLEELAKAKKDVNRLFIGSFTGGKWGKGGIGALSSSAVDREMHSLAKEAKVDWHLNAHQLRRAFARTWVRHPLGDKRFLKTQLQHSTMKMTDLYAANPMQDESLYKEISEEADLLKAEIMAGWQDESAPLAGGAGEKIIMMRAHAVKDREALIMETAKTMRIRGTGHSWCLAQDDGCGGVGLFEKTRCGDGCSNAVIDEWHIEVWQGIHVQSLELRDVVRDLGPGAAEKVERDIEISKRVLTKLGVPIPMESVKLEQRAVAETKKS